MNAVRRVEACLEAIAQENPRLNAFTHVDAEGALAAARALGEGPGPLHGRVVGVKDNIAVAGLPWTGGLEGRRGVIATEDAAVVRRLRAAGAIIIGTLNQHEGALGGTTDNAAYGRTLNPLGEGLTPGGSSGGSGAAVAAGMVDLALGSDTMGSVRLPAAYCGVSGLKPTFGLVPRTGFLYLAPSLDTIGPLTRDVELLWPALVAIAGADPGDPDSRRAPHRWSRRPDNGSPLGLSVGIPREVWGVGMTEEADVLFQRAIAVAIGAGMETEAFDLTGWDPRRARRAGLLIGEAEGAAEMAELIDRPGAMTEGLAAMLRYGRDAPSAKLVRAQATVRAAGAACLNAFEKYDALLLPTAPQQAFGFDDPVPDNQADLTALANFAGCPSVAVPVPGEGLPGSVQLMGPPWSEARLTMWAAMLAERMK